MKSLFILFTAMLFYGCGKSNESVCMKGEIIATDCCGTWAINITEGPQIGVKVLGFDNVIQLYNNNTADRNFGNPGVTIYFKIRDIKDGDLKPCLLYCANIGYSSIAKIATSVSLTSCQ